MNFDEIRPYYDGEVEAKIKSLLEEEQFQQVVQMVHAEVPFEMFKQKMLSIKDVKQFQTEIIIPILDILIQKSSHGLSLDGLENLEKDTAYLFVSTHRDIVLDSALMNYLLLKQGYETAEIAIGDNLMKIPWIVDLVKLNKTFIVKRNMAKEDKVQASLQLSSYINHTILEKKNSIWIAQKSGRSKDGDDRTNPSLLKMFNLAAPGDDSLSNIKALNICPISVAYEYNPCDVLTMPELMAIEKGQRYEKAPMEDMIHMAEGIQGQKGKVSVSFGKPLNTMLKGMEDIKNRNDLFNALAKTIDQEIHETYHLMDTNFIAYDLLFGEGRFKERYSEEEKSAFVDYMEERLAQVEGIEEFTHHTFLKMYANPVINKSRLH